MSPTSGAEMLQPSLYVTSGISNDIAHVDGPCVDEKGAQLRGEVGVGVGNVDASVGVDTK